MSRRTAFGPPRAAAAEVQPRRPIFTDATIRVLARAAGKEPRRGANLGAVAARLSEAVVEYILWSRSDQNATAGKAAGWARGQAKHAAEFLAGFGMSPDPGASPVRAEALALLFEALPPGTATREDVRRDLEAVRRLHALASAAAGTYEARKGKPRQPNDPLRELFACIAIAYLRACGGKLGTSTNPHSGEAVGPFVRFAQKALDVMVRRQGGVADFDAKALSALRARPGTSLVI